MYFVLEAGVVESAEITLVILLIVVEAEVARVAALLPKKILRYLVANP